MGSRWSWPAASSLMTRSLRRWKAEFPKSM